MVTFWQVVRAGLTPKWKDVDTLCEMLTYSDGAPHYVVPTPVANEAHVARYVPPSEVDEFMLERVELPSAGALATLPATEGLAIVLVVSGTAAIEQLDDTSEDAIGLRHQLTKGAVHLVCPYTVLQVRAVSGPTLLFRAAAKPHIKDNDPLLIPSR